MAAIRTRIFSSGRWRIKLLFGNVFRSFATYGVHVSAIACLKIAWESLAASIGLPCVVPGVAFGNVAPVGVLIMAFQACSPGQSKQEQRSCQCQS